VAGPALLHDPELGTTWLYVDGVVASTEHPEAAVSWRRWVDGPDDVSMFVKRLVASGTLTSGLYSIIDGTDPDLNVALVVLEEFTCRWTVPQTLKSGGDLIDVSTLDVAEWVRQAVDDSLDVRRH
jgi:hypothetical protein